MGGKGRGAKQQKKMGGKGRGRGEKEEKNWESEGMIKGEKKKKEGKRKEGHKNRQKPCFKNIFNFRGFCTHPIPI